MAKTHECAVDDLVPKNHWVRELDKMMDYDWLVERIKPYWPEVSGPEDAPIRMVGLVMLQHLGLRSTDERFTTLAYAHQMWRENTSFWWLLRTWIDNIPPLGEVCCGPAEKLPPELLCEIFNHILTRCVRNHLLDECHDDPLYELGHMPETERGDAIAQLSQAYTNQLLQEVAEMLMPGTSKCVSN